MVYDSSKKGIGITVSPVLIIIILSMFMATYASMAFDNQKTKTYLCLDDVPILRIESTFHLINKSIGTTRHVQTAQSAFRADDESTGCGYDKFKQTTTIPLTQPAEPGLEIIGRDIYYNRKKIYLVGVSRREALRRETGEDGKTWDDFGHEKYSLEWYENEIIKYRFNYVRHDATNDYNLLRKHVLKMRNHGIIVELTLWDRERGYLADIEKILESIGDLNNVIYEPVNEISSRKDVEVAKELIEYLVGKGYIVSAGAWSGASGQSFSDQINGKNQIITVHRTWDKASILRYLSANKPILRNEYFDMDSGLGVGGIRRIMEESFEAGAAGVNYYGFRMEDLGHISEPDPEPYYKYLEIAQEINYSLNEGHGNGKQTINAASNKQGI